MASCTDTSSRATTLLSCPPLRPMTGGAVRPVVAGVQTAVRRGWQVTSIAPAFGRFQGGAVAATGTAAVIDLMVTDHPYSTRLGPPSCSPPV